MPTQLPVALYTGAQIRELDRRAIHDHGIPAPMLMERAGAAAFAVLCGRWPRARRIAVVCGNGNNGGDGYELARLARQAGWDVTALALSERMNTPVAEQMRRAAVSAGVPIQSFSADALDDVDVIVDALLGIGLTRPLAGAVHDAVAAMNGARRPVLALDMPSGLSADTGAIMGAAVRADVTVSFIGLKVGLYTGYGRECAGEIHLDNLDVSMDVYRDTTPAAFRVTPQELATVYPRRQRHGHKGDYGTVLVIGGGIGMPGAARLAGEAAYRAGAGLVLVATHLAHAAALSNARPELLVYGVHEPAELSALLARADAIAIGPGLGRDAWGAALLGHVLDAAGTPLVVDADALNLLALEPAKRTRWVLTPHPGEAGRLLGVSTTAVQDDRLSAAHALAERYGGVCALKGSGTLVAEAGRDALALCDAGNPGMASGGTGDVLTGAIAALLAQGLAPYDAARLGVWVHATAGDAAAHDGEIGLVASDLFPHLRHALNRIAADEPDDSDD